MSPSDFRYAMRVIGFLVILAASGMALVLVGIVAFSWIEVILP